MSAKNNAAISLRPAAAEDRFRIRRWLAGPLTEACWGNAASAEAEINIAMGSDAALCRILECAGVPIGYAHALDVGLLHDGKPGDMAPWTWHVNLLVAPGVHPGGRNRESAALGLIVREVFATTLAVACAGLVSVRSEAAARAFERAGFRWKRICADRLLGPCWLMLLERPR